MESSRVKKISVNHSFCRLCNISKRNTYRINKYQASSIRDKICDFKSSESSESGWKIQKDEARRSGKHSEKRSNANCLFHCFLLIYVYCMCSTAMNRSQTRPTRTHQCQCLTLIEHLFRFLFTALHHNQNAWQQNKKRERNCVEAPKSSLTHKKEITYAKATVLSLCH